MVIYVNLEKPVCVKYTAENKKDKVDCLKVLVINLPSNSETTHDALKRVWCTMPPCSSDEVTMPDSDPPLM